MISIRSQTSTFPGRNVGRAKEIDLTTRWMSGILLKLKGLYDFKDILKRADGIYV